jgi:hypothetical protein
MVRSTPGLVGVFDYGHRLLTGHVWKTIEVFVEAQTAFQIGEQAFHLHACALEAGRPAPENPYAQRYTEKVSQHAKIAATSSRSTCVVVQS